tara:strand:+ start:9820 stop:11040 length:1221 start_codon:yes stop_codon:yes gene_type:complete
VNKTIFKLLNLKKLFRFNKIDLLNLSQIEQFFALAISYNPKRFDKEINKKFDLIGDQKIWEFAKNERSESIISNTLIDVLNKKGISNRWLLSSKEIGEKIKLYMQELDYLASELKKINIQIIALKNSGIARGIFKNYSASPMGDIDVLVNPEDFYEAHKQMIKLGYEFSDRSPFAIKNVHEAFEHGGAEYICKLPNGKKLWIELQWRPVAGRWIQPSQEPSVSDLFKNSIPIKGSCCRLLSPEDNLLQVCLHTAKHSYVRSPGFRLHTDVDRIVSHYEIDWEKFYKKVVSLKVRTPVYLSLLIPKMLLKSEVPKIILEKLNFSPFKHSLLQSWLLKVGLFSPEEKKWNRFGYIFFNLLLFDDFFDLFKAVFPDSNYLKKNSYKKNFLFFIYLNRIFSLLFNRSKNT